ncbi:MAG: alpha/beta fold hydrolase [Anaerolineales bacterium]|jgi:pimeloyl-ACP methyl ester carboxylesterase
MPIASEIYYFQYTKSSKSTHPPIVLIHGAGGSHLFWPPQIRRLPGHHVFSLDLPGHGKSSGRVRQSIGAYVQDILDWMDSIGLNRAVFIGHSMGSAIAQTLAIHYPDYVVGLGLIGSGAAFNVNPELLDRTSSPSTFDSGIAIIIKNSFSPTASERLVKLAKKRILETNYSVLYADFKVCDNFDEILSVYRITQPTLILCGADDKMTPPRFSIYLNTKIRNSELEIIPHAGHMVMLEQPDAVAISVSKFMDKFFG